MKRYYADIRGFDEPRYMLATSLDHALAQFEEEYGRRNVGRVKPA